MFGKVVLGVIVLLLVSGYSVAYDDQQANNTLMIFGERLDALEDKVSSIHSDVLTINSGLDSMSASLENMDKWLGQILVSSQNRMIFIVALVCLLVCLNMAVTVTMFNFVFIPRLLKVMNPQIVDVKLKPIDWTKLSKEIETETKKNPKGNDRNKNKEVSVK